jgi:8-oxo-dGTP diphosphatase
VSSEQEFLDGYRPGRYPAVAVTVDLVVLAVAGGVLHTILIQRGAHPPTAPRTGIRACG